MSTLEQRQTLLALITEACVAGARLHTACALIGLALRVQQNQGLELFLKHQQSGGLGQRAVLAAHLALQLLVAALQLTQRRVGKTLLGGAGHRGLAGGAKGIAPLDQLVLEQALLTAPGVQRMP